MTKLKKNKSTPSNGLSDAWETFAQKLATVLERLNKDDYMCLLVKRSERYVRFSMEEAGMRVEITSNLFLEKQEKLEEQQISSLIAAGWIAPTWKPGDPMSNDDAKGCPNFFIDLTLPVSFNAVASMTVHTLAGILHVPNPRHLEYFAFDKTEVPLEFPELGLTLAEIEKNGVKPEDLSRQLLEIIRETIGVNDLEFDEEGDIGVRYRSALSFVRMNYDNLFVSMFSKILTDVQESTAVISRLNDINSEEIMVRVFYKDGVIYGVADIPALPFVGAHVAESFGYFCDAADRMGNLLKAEFGGQTAFEEYTPSTMLH
jgi:hypothetical protein